MDRVLGTISGEGYSCVIREDMDGRVFFTADADIDADGANGQNGGVAVYRVDDKGSEALANGGMTIIDGKVVCAKPWARSIVILDRDNEPKVFPGGVIASMTWYRHPGKMANDPAAYVDAETVPYIVVPPLIVQQTAGVVRGCKANGKIGDVLHFIIFLVARVNVPSFSHCEAFSVYGFIGVERETVMAMRSWVKTDVVPADPGR